MPRRVFEKIDSLRRQGLMRGIRVRSERLFLAVLARYYKFHPWHVLAPASSRSYRHTVAQLINDLKPTTVVEVGCGLGYNLTRIDAPKCYGYDVDEGAIRAARFLHGRKITFVHGDMTAVSLPQIDVLILVNWIHEISPLDLEKQLTPLLPRTRYLILDAIDPDNHIGYRYKHDFAFLKSKASRLSVTRHPGEGRSFQLFEVVA